MRCVAVLALLAGVCCAGCAHTGLHSSAFSAQAPGGYSHRQPAGASATYRLPPRANASLLLGSAIGAGVEAIDGYSETEFGNGTIFGAEGVYLFPAQQYGPAFTLVSRYGVALRIEQYGMLLSELGFDFGTLNITSVVLAFKFYQIPREGNRFGFHFDAGFGIASSSFSKSSMLKQEEISTGNVQQIHTDPGTIFALGAGLDFYATPVFAISLDFRYVGVLVPMEWSVGGIPIANADTFDATNYQFTLGFCFFF